MVDVSVIIPVYNTGKYLKRCFDSILKQEHKNIEIIVIDDGSTDESGKICDEYAKRDDRFIVKHTENFGVSNARNLGLKEATGKYFCFVDSDDTVSKDYVSLLYNNAEKYGCVVSAARNCNDRNTVKSLDKIKVMTRNEARFSVTDRKAGLKGFVCCKLYKTDIMKANNLRFHTEFTLLEDLIFIFEYLKHCSCEDKICLSFKVIYKYCSSRSDSALKQRFSAPEYKEKWYDSVRAADFLIKENEAVFGIDKAAQKLNKRLKNELVCEKVIQSVTQMRILAHYNKTDDPTYRTCRKNITENIFVYLTNKHITLKQKLGAIAILFFKNI
ncbi:MAG: glycosyltransferase [Clostridia bacterium]|nr:glycosyltransferase [Clostridia bacterium]